MSFIIFTILISIVAIVVYAIGKQLSKSSVRDDAAVGRAMIKITPIAWVILFVIITFINSYNQVDAGTVRVVYSFGEITGQISEGPNFVAPWKSTKEQSIQVQSHKFKGLACFSNETQPVWVDATLNISVSPDSIQSLIRNVGTDYFEKIVLPRVQQNFKDATVLYKSIEVAPNREEIRKNVANKLKAECSPYSINVIDLLLDDINFSDEFERAIENKQIATQQALEEERRVEISKHQADQRIEYARGVADSILAVAEKQAQANRELNSSLTPSLIQYTMVQKLSDKIEVMLLPAGQSFMLSPDMLKH